MLFENYRKAKKNETTCEKCYYSEERFWSKSTLDCTYAGYYYCVGKKHTCEHAIDRQKRIAQITQEINNRKNKGYS